MLQKEPENVIYRATEVEGPTFTWNGLISIQTGAIPSQGLAAFITYADYRESVFSNLKKGDKNYYFGDNVWLPYTRNHEDRFKAITFDYNSFALRSINQNDHLVVVADIVARKDFNNIFVHIHEFDAAVHLDSLKSDLAIEKIEKTNEAMKALIESIDDDTTLVIASDHGLSNNGHGGFDEISRIGVFFAYRKKGFVGSRRPEFAVKREKFREMDICNILHYYIGTTSPLNSYGDLPPELL